MKLEKIIQCMEELAPLHLAEEWDNCGLMLGHKEMEVQGIVTTLDVTPECVDWVIAQGCNVIVSHHPLFFKGIKRLLLDSYQGKLIEKLIKHDIAVYSAHTNLDIAEGGLNDMLAKVLGLHNVRGLKKTRDELFYKLVCYVPVEASEQIRQALAKVGAGRLGDYEACSFSVEGTGRFLPLHSANPHIGKIGSLERVNEERIEVLVSEHILAKTIDTLLSVHPYEEPAYEAIPLTLPKKSYYLGRIGSLAGKMSGEEFIIHVQKCLPQTKVRYAGIVPEVVEQVALCSGAASDFMSDAQQKGADVYLTGDVKYHEAQQAKDMEFFVIDAGHFGTEELVAGELRDYLQTAVGAASVSILAYMEQDDYFSYIEAE